MSNDVVQLPVEDKDARNLYDALQQTFVDNTPDSMGIATGIGVVEAVALDIKMRLLFPDVYEVDE